MGLNFFIVPAIDDKVVSELLNIKRVTDIHEKGTSEENFKEYLRGASSDIEEVVHAIQNDYAPTPKNDFTPK